MSDEVDRFFENAERGIVPHQHSGHAHGENVIEGQFIEVVERGPSLADGIRDIGGQIWDALTPAFEKGADELVKAFYTENAFTYHGSTIPEQEPHHGLPIEPLHREQHEMEERGM